jgi:ribosomal protein L7/L12
MWILNACVGPQDHWSGSADVIVLAQLGKKIEAISRFRKLTGATRLDAKVMIDSH